MTDRLLASIEALAIDPPGARVTFVDRLAAENGWTGAQAAAVIREYRCFLYLAATVADPMTPSDAVDQAWHLHLSYTRSYWDDLCGRVLGRPLHHQPTQGGPQEAARYRRHYAATLARYAAAFGTPPEAIWPPLKQRFAGSFVRTDRRLAWIIPRRTAALWMLPLVGMLSTAATADVPSIIIPIVILVLVVAIALWRQRKAKRRGDSDIDFDSGDADGGGCGGCGGD